ncbi:OmpP1/FadL family transporter [Roseisolibacter agri]|uniref:Long-chain fatty acid transporter n=1 Tax=Roseisolibacter agri TaxID=2014610 RepID=A0AA37Q5W3_9BACT|nr:outer membrane protein transport protein [Roseisolibacter agri]GLC27154.1 long-chain fatty acid transporter [Roseisolibacter agri]
MQFRAHARRAVRAGGAPALVLATVLSAAASPAHAQGFGLNEIGSCAIARGFAVTGAPCEDASVLYWNPGATASVPRGLSLYGGVTAIQVKGSFTHDVTARREEGDVPVEFPPFLGATWKGSGPTSSRLALGVAAYVPYGLTSQWADDFSGRFAAQKASLQTIYVQPTIGFDLVPGRFSIGAGPVIGHSSIEIRQAIDFSQQLAPAPAPAGTRFGQLGFAPGTEFATAQIKGGSKLAYGAHVGAQLKLTPSLSLGARYLTSVKFEYDDADATFTPSATASSYVLPGGNALGAPAGTTLAQLTAPQFQAGGTLAPGQTASTEIEHPAQFQVGIGFTGIPGTTLSADYGRTFWSSFDVLPVTFPATASGAASPLTRTLIEEYEDISSYRVGLEHRFGSAGVTGGMLNGVAGRLGFSYAESPAPDQTVTPLLPDMNRYNFSGGLGIPLGGSLTLDAAYLRVETEGRRGRTDERPESLTPSQTVQTLNSGWYALNANIFSVSLKARF